MILVPAKWVWRNYYWSLEVGSVTVGEVQRTANQWAPILYGEGMGPVVVKHLAAAKRAVEKALKARTK